MNKRNADPSQGSFSQKNQCHFGIVNQKTGVFMCEMHNSGIKHMQRSLLKGKYSLPYHFTVEKIQTRGFIKFLRLNEILSRKIKIKSRIPNFCLECFFGFYIDTTVLKLLACTMEFDTVYSIPFHFHRPLIDCDASYVLLRNN